MIFPFVTSRAVRSTFNKRIVAVRVIDHDRKIAVMRHAFKSSRRAGAFLQSARVITSSEYPSASPLATAASVL